MEENMPFLGGKHVVKEGIIIKYLTIKCKNVT